LVLAADRRVSCGIWRNGHCPVPDGTCDAAACQVAT